MNEQEGSHLCRRRRQHRATPGTRQCSVHMSGLYPPEDFICVTVRQRNFYLQHSGQAPAASCAQSSDYRVVVFGAAGVGKSSLVQRFVRGTFHDTYIPTVEDTYRQVISCDRNVCTLQITDTTGSHQFPAMQRLSISKGHAFILVYSVTSRQSLEELKPIYQQIRHIKGDAQAVPIMLVGNKSDETQRELQAGDGEGLAAHQAISMSRNPRALLGVSLSSLLQLSVSFPCRGSLPAVRGLRESPPTRDVRLLLMQHACSPAQGALAGAASPSCAHLAPRAVPRAAPGFPPRRALIFPLFLRSTCICSPQPVSAVQSAFHYLLKGPALAARTGFTLFQKHAGQTHNRLGSSPCCRHSLYPSGSSPPSCMKGDQQGWGVTPVMDWRPIQHPGCVVRSGVKGRLSWSPTDSAGGELRAETAGAEGDYVKETPGEGEEEDEEEEEEEKGVNAFQFFYGEWAPQVCQSVAAQVCRTPSPAVCTFFPISSTTRMPLRTRALTQFKMSSKMPSSNNIAQARRTVQQLRIEANIERIKGGWDLGFEPPTPGAPCEGHTSSGQALLQGQPPHPPRLGVSKASADLMHYCGEHAKHDPLLMGIPASENPFKDKKPCTIL
ncbi:DIRA2 protein, partial [Atractosteus spatula]|nr:DIRA2 protein [Atractosteus spatula]